MSDKISIFLGKLTKNFDFFRQKFSTDFLVHSSKMSVYPGKICNLQLISGQIILFRLISHHFRTYFLYIRVMIFYFKSLWWQTMNFCQKLSEMTFILFF